MSPLRANTRMLIGLGIVLLTLIGMLAFTWRTWPEPVIDFGRELYVPWQLSEGKLLYRDIAYFNGPLSPYFNALIFKVLGVSLMKLVAVNIAILVGVSVMLHRLAAKMSDEVTATIACCAFVILLAVGQPGPVGNYNFITPYSHEMTHGIALSLASILCLVRFIETRKVGWISASGALIGLVFLTKPEIFLAASIAISIGFVLATRASKRRWVELCAFVACGFAIVILAFGFLSIALSTHEAASGLLGAWRWSLDSRITSNPFYQWVRGTLDLNRTLEVLLATTAGYVILFALPAAIGWFVGGDRARRVWQLSVSFAIVTALLFILKDWINWQEVARPLLFVTMIGVCVAWFGLKSDTGILKMVFSIFALLLLGKIALHVQFFHYGFALAAPALVLAIVTLQCWLPAWINHNGRSGAIVRGASLAAIVVTAGMYISYQAAVVTHKTTRVGTGGDAFYAFDAGRNVNRVVERLKQTPPGSTVVVVPQGVMVNYLSRRASSIPFIVQMPPEVIMFTQGRILGSFQQHPPDYVVYLGTNSIEYGFRGYNADFGKPMFDWILANYSPVEGDPRDPNLKWMLFKRNVSADK